MSSRTKICRKPFVSHQIFRLGSDALILTRYQFSVPLTRGSDLALGKSCKLLLESARIIASKLGFLLESLGLLLRQCVGGGGGHGGGNGFWNGFGWGWSDGHFLFS
ncbi:indolepyruvate ferredoxin oxidoreductase [Striga asiatica]|uniref:Indolepyruvate ferredoxin oxidoreductase n=1 Tax=Striga asiatica TaxID=4170 RepID=A0A5A7P921_STRAF|nr:indolepyruvate ferredoxin oxidoreductase [Striga asiatica]